jgi:hypothetical protein
LTGSLILRVKSNYTSWFEHLIYAYGISNPSSTTENTHYIWIKEDFSNLLEVMEWCLKNDDKCKQIAQNALEFAREKSRKEYILQYVSMILWSVNDKFSSLYEKKSSSSIKTVSSYNPSPHTPSQVNQAYEQFLSNYKLTGPSPLQPQEFEPHTPSPKERYSMMQPPQVYQSPPPSPPLEGFNPQSPTQGYMPQTPSNSPPQQFIPQTPSNSPPPSPPTPPEGFTQQPTVSPNMSEILTELKEIKDDLDELKEEKSESTGGSSIVDNILDVKDDVISETENSEYIKGGNTKKIKLI